MTDLLIVDDHDYVRSSLKLALSAERDLEVVGEASNGREAIELCRRLRPNIILMDVRMPEMDGLVATREIKRQWPNICILILTMHENPDYLWEAVRAGAAGYVLKDAPRERLVSAIRQVLNGESPLEGELAARVLRRLAEESKKPTAEAPARPKPAQPSQPLTPRELEVLKVMALGQTNREIARNFSISLGTVKRHVENIVAKLEVSDRTQAVVQALALGIISFPDV